MYRIQFQPWDVELDGGFTDMSMQEVHWTRVVHIADNREISEIYGVPRLQLVYNACLDLEKIFGSSGEMFYKGAYPGFVVEATDNLLNTVQLDSESIRQEVEKYENNFQRWMAIKNAHINALSSSYADPAGHVERRNSTGPSAPLKTALLPLQAEKRQMGRNFTARLLCGFLSRRKGMPAKRQYRSIRFDPFSRIAKFCDFK